MADESLELEDGELLVADVVNGPSAADVQLRAQLHEAATVLRNNGQPELARLALGLVDADVRHAIWILDDGVWRGDFSGDPVPFDAFRRTIHMRLIIRFEETGGYNEDVISQAFPAMVLEAAQHAANLALTDDIDEPYRDGGFGAVPASSAAVRSLEKQTFRAAVSGGGDDDGIITECSICTEEFVEGGQISVMPCPSGVHKFHPDCIAKWLGVSNTCPLCRHELPPTTSSIVYI